MKTSHRGFEPVRLRPLAPSNPVWRPSSRTATHDPRWPAIAARLAALRERGRFAVRIVDADCGAGCLLIHALHHARSLGFTAIEGRGIDGSPALIGRARAAAACRRDPAIGVAFEVADMVKALAEEEELPADIVLWHGTGTERVHPGALAAVRCAGEIVFSDERAGADRAA